MKTPKQLLSIFALVYVLAPLRAQDCDIWLEKMNKEHKKDNDVEAAKMLKYFINCQNEILPEGDPIRENINNLVILSTFENGYASCMLSGGIDCIINDSFTEIKKFNSIGIGEFHNGLASFVTRDGKEGFLNYQGEIIIPAQYNDVSDIYENVFLAKTDKGWGLVNRDEKVLVEFGKYDYIDIFSGFENGLVRVNDYENNFGFIDVNGNEVIPTIYKDVRYNGESLIAVTTDKYTWHFVNKNGKKAALGEFEDAGGLSEGLAYVKKDGKYGYIDQYGNLKIPYQYDNARSFRLGLASVKINGKYGFIDKNQNTILPFIYDIAYGFSPIKETASVQLNKEWMEIDTDGNCTDCD